MIKNLHISDKMLGLIKPLIAITMTVSFQIAIARVSHQVEKRGQESKVLLEKLVGGHLTELNGKYMLRLSEVNYKAGGFIGIHHHAGPGIRYVLSGTLTYIEAGKTTIYGPGTYFYESGSNVHTAINRGKVPVRLVNFELLPANRKGGSANLPRR